jgi:hypothetical protein
MQTENFPGVGHLAPTCHPLCREIECLSGSADLLCLEHFNILHGRKKAQEVGTDYAAPLELTPCVLWGCTLEYWSAPSSALRVLADGHLLLPVGRGEGITCSGSGVQSANPFGEAAPHLMGRGELMALGYKVQFQGVDGIREQMGRGYRHAAPGGAWVSGACGGVCVALRCCDRSYL